MVLSKEKLIYIHIPKTGGISIEEFIQNVYGYKRNTFLLNHGFGVYNSYNNGMRTIYPHMHYPLPHVIQELSKSKIEVDNTWNIFSIVRNPYDKLLSAMFYDEKLPLKYNYFTLPINQRSYYLDSMLEEYIDSDTNFNYHSNHTYPQYLFFENIDLKYKIFKFEVGLKNILTELGFDGVDKLKHRLNTFALEGLPKTDYKTMYTSKLIDHVNKIYKQDFELFDYEVLDPNNYP